MPPYHTLKDPFQPHPPKRSHRIRHKIRAWVKSIPDHQLIAWCIALIPIILLFLGIGIFKLLPITGYSVAVRAESYSVTPTPFQPVRLTPTPFQPLLHPTIVFETKSSEITPTPDIAPFNVLGIDFEPGQARINITLLPQSTTLNQGQPIVMSFLPGESCMFSDGYGCVTQFYNDAGGKIIFVTLHSGIGGEAQSFRHAVEGTSFGRAGFTLAQTLNNLQAAAGSSVNLAQGSLQQSNLQLVHATRLPATQVAPYFNRAIPEALTFAIEQDPELSFVATTTETVIIFETCGWRIMEEEWPAGHPETSGAVYLGVIAIP